MRSRCEHNKILQYLRIGFMYNLSSSHNVSDFRIIEIEDHCKYISFEIYLEKKKKISSLKLLNLSFPQLNAKDV